jgi:hypothetical protein
MPENRDKDLFPAIAQRVILELGGKNGLDVLRLDGRKVWQ